MIRNIKKIGFSYNEKYVSQALTEIKGSSEELQNAGIRFIGSAAHGFQLAEFGIQREELVAAIRMVVDASKMVFVRHCCIYDFQLGLTEEEMGNDEKIAALAKHLLERLDLHPELTAFSIQGRAFEQREKQLLDDVRIQLEELIIKEGKSLEVKYPQQIISLFLRENELMAGVGLPTENLSRWSGGLAHYRQETWEVSRSMYKLMEAMEVFGIKTEGGMRALDLGAAPGGWSSVLLRRGMRVTSVDTGELDPTLLKEKALEFAKINASDLEQHFTEKYGSNSPVYDLLVSDMSWSAMKTAVMVCEAAKYLKPGGTAIVTVKLLNGKPVKSLTEVKKIYSQVFEILGCRQLFHNREEVTLCMRKPEQA